MRNVMLYLDREAVLVPNLDGGVLQRRMIIIEIQGNLVGLLTAYLKRNEEAKLAARFWELLSNVLHLEKTMMTP